MSLLYNAVEVSVVVVVVVVVVEAPVLVVNGSDVRFCSFELICAILMSGK
jgi:hypothetical protein